MIAPDLDYGVGDHCHHNKLVEVIEGLTGRVACINTEKPEEERPLRLRLIQVWPDELLPEAMRDVVRQARQAWARRGDYLDKYKPLHDDYWAKYTVLRRLITRHMPELVALHAQTCPDCPWDGKSIFPKGARP